MSVEQISERMTRLESVEKRLEVAEAAIRVHEKMIAELSTFSQASLTAFEALLAQNKALTEQVIKLMEES